MKRRERREGKERKGRIQEEKKRKRKSRGGRVKAESRNNGDFLVGRGGRGKLTWISFSFLLRSSLLSFFNPLLVSLPVSLFNRWCSGQYRDPTPTETPRLLSYITPNIPRITRVYTLCPTTTHSAGCLFLFSSCSSPSGLPQFSILVHIHHYELGTMHNSSHRSFHPHSMERADNWKKGSKTVSDVP